MRKSRTPWKDFTIEKFSVNSKNKSPLSLKVRSLIFGARNQNEKSHWLFMASGFLFLFIYLYTSVAIHSLLEKLLSQVVRQSSCCKDVDRLSMLSCKRGRLDSNQRPTGSNNQIASVAFPDCSSAELLPHKPDKDCVRHFNLTKDVFLHGILVVL